MDLNNVYEKIKLNILNNLTKNPFEKEIRISTLGIIPKKNYSLYINYILDQLTIEGLNPDLDEYGGITITI